MIELSQLKPLPLSPALFCSSVNVQISLFYYSKSGPTFFSPNISYDAFCVIPPGLDRRRPWTGARELPKIQWSIGMQGPISLRSDLEDGTVLSGT